MNNSLDTERAAFLATILEQPDDDTVRLVFADWLQDRGDPRAEGYRALVTLGLAPRRYGGSGRDRRWEWGESLTCRGSHLCASWYAALASATGFRTRWDAEAAAALAFGTLRPEQRAAILRKGAGA
jgi:uncharacterized protein (TIGR02996 family)